MVYKEVFERVQACEMNIGYSRAVDKDKLRDSVQELTGRRVRHIRIPSLSVTDTRGIFLRAPKARISGGIAENGNPDVILTPSGLADTYMERFIYVKELMHVFEKPDHYTAIADDFRGLIGDIDYSVVKKCEQAKSDMAARWIALSLMCNDQDRIRCLEEYRETREKDYHDIIEDFRIPGEVIGGLFEDRYDDMVFEAKQRFF